MRHIIATLLCLCLPFASHAKPANPPKPFKQILVVSSYDPVIGVKGRKLGALDVIGVVAVPLLIVSDQVGKSEVAERSGSAMQALGSSKLMLATELRNALIEGLRSAGSTQVEELPEKYFGSEEKPWNVDSEVLEKITDAYLSVEIDTATLKAYSFSDGYEPVFNVKIRLVDTHSDDEVYEEEFIYGATAKSNKKFHFPSSEDCKFPNFEFVTSNGAKVGQCFRDGVAQIASLALSELRPFIQPRNPAP